MDIREVFDRGIAMCEGRKAIGNFVEKDEQGQLCFCIFGVMYAGTTGKIPPSARNNWNAADEVRWAIEDGLGKAMTYNIYGKGLVHRNDSTNKTLRELADEVIASVEQS